MTSAPTAGGRLRDAWAVGDFRVLALAFLVTMLGGAVASLAITVLVFQTTGSSLLASLTFVAMFLPYLVSGTLLSSLTDRWPKRRLLVVCNLVSAATIAVMALPGLPVAARLGLLVLLGLVSPVSAGASSALVARSLPAAAYVPGRAVMRVIAQGAQVFGAAAGGVLLAMLAPTGVLVVDSVGYLVAALLVGTRLRSGRDATEPGDGASVSGVLRDSWTGMHAVLARRPVRRGLLLVWIVPVFVVAPEALGAPYVQQAGLPAPGVGVWFVALPLGNLLGAVLGVWLLDPRRRRQLIRPLAVAGPALLAPVAVVPFAAAWVLALACGLTSAYALGLDQYLLDTTPEPLLSRMFTVQASGLMTLQGLGFALWGALGEALPAATVIGLAGVLGVLAVAPLRLGDVAARDADPVARPNSQDR